MATRRHLRGVLLFLLAAFLVLPPLTSAVAAGFGVDLTHHHCDSHGDDASTDDVDDDDLDRHGSAESDPFQCDQCHIVLAALNDDASVPDRFTAPLPEPGVIPELFSVRTPPAFKPPIA
ncbi:MAG: hypothetical protein GKS03_05740 [Alphaproteobacteria bacterium]|nr:hypothetical protein [Alphaproteobacteria bacterium]